MAKRSLMFFVLPLLVWCGIAVSTFGHEPNPGQGETLKDAVRNRLRTALKDEDYLTSVMAAERLAYLGGVDQPTRTALIEAMMRPENHYGFSAGYIDALASSGPQAIPDLLKAIQRIQPPSTNARQFWSDNASKNAKAYIALIASIARMGPEARTAILPLRAMLDNPDIDRRVKPAIRIALANIGYDSANNVAAILRSLREDFTDTFRSALLIIDVVQPGPWATKEVIAELCKKMQWVDHEKRPRASSDFAILLGMCETRADFTASTLDKFRKLALTDHHQGDAVLFTFALARITPKRQHELLRELCKNLGPGIESISGGVYLRLRQHRLVDASISKHLAGLIADPDPAVARNAVDLLLLSGKGARYSLEQVLTFVGSDAEEERRADASRLFMYGDESILPRLQACLKRERSEIVRSALQSAIHAMYMEKEDP